MKAAELREEIAVELQGCQRFCSPPHPGLPELFHDKLVSALAPYRRFRHVAFHSYAFQLDWSRMAEGVGSIEDVFLQFKASLYDYLDKISA